MEILVQGGRMIIIGSSFKRIASRRQGIDLLPGGRIIGHNHFPCSQGIGSIRSNNTSLKNASRNLISTECGLGGRERSRTLESPLIRRVTIEWTGNREDCLAFNKSIISRNGYIGILPCRQRNIQHQAGRTQHYIRTILSNSDNIIRIIVPGHNGRSTRNNRRSNGEITPNFLAIEVNFQALGSCRDAVHSQAEESAELIEIPTGTGQISGNHRAGRSFAAHLSQRVAAGQGHIQLMTFLTIVLRIPGYKSAGINGKGIALIASLIHNRKGSILGMDHIRDGSTVSTFIRGIDIFTIRDVYSHIVIIRPGKGRIFIRNNDLGAATAPGNGFGNHFNLGYRLILFKNRKIFLFLARNGKKDQCRKIKKQLFHIEYY